MKQWPILGELPGLPDGHFVEYCKADAEFTARMMEHEWKIENPLYIYPETYVSHLFGKLWEAMGDTAFDPEVHEAFFALQDEVIGEQEW